MCQHAMDAQHRTCNREHQGIPETPQARCSAAGPLSAQPGGKLPTTTTFCRRGMCLVLLGNCATLHPSVLGAHAVRAVLQFHFLFFHSFSSVFPLVGSRFWFWVPFRQNGIKNGINLNCDWTILFHFLFHAVSRPKRKRINNYIGIFYSKGHTSTFGCKKENVWCTYRKFAKLLENNMFESSNIEQRNMEGGKVNRNR